MILSSFFSLVSIFLFFLAPTNYSFSFNVICLILFIFINIYYFICRSKENGVGFEYFFMISFCMTNFIYPVFYYADNRYVSLFSFGFNDEVINKSTALALVAYGFYIIGLQLYRKSSSVKINYYQIKIDPFYPLVFLILSIVSFVGFVIFGGLDHFKSVYSGEEEWAAVGTFSYFFMIFNFSSMLLAMFIFKCSNNIIRMLGIIFLILSILMLLLSGSRMTAVGIVLVLLVSYSKNIKNISLASTSLVVFISSILLYIVMLYRSFFYAGTASGEEIYLNISNNFSFFDGFMDLIINNRNLYILVDFVDNHGSVYFANVFYNIISFLPFSQNINNMVGIPEYLNGNLVSFLEFGGKGGFGLGTNNVAEAYLAFGMVGVILFFTLLGYILSMVREKASFSIVFYIIYFIFVSIVVIYPRGNILINTRVFVWTLLLFFAVFLLKKILMRVVR